MQVGRTHVARVPCRVVQKAAASESGGICRFSTERCNSTQYEYIPTSEAGGFPSAVESPCILLNHVHNQVVPAEVAPHIKIQFHGCIQYVAVRV
jgi:hypothetical protein